MEKELGELILFIIRVLNHDVLLSFSALFWAASIFN